MSTYDKNNDTNKSANRDPITGEPGSHPVGTGLGTLAGAAAAVAGTVAAGAAMGSVVGPLGTAAGAIVGGVAGAFAGKGVAEAIDPTAEDAYWEQNYSTRPYADKTATYDTYRPAYHYGVNAYNQNAGKSFDDIQSNLESGWNSARGQSSLDWTKAKEATRDAYDRVSMNSNSTLNSKAS